MGLNIYAFLDTFYVKILLNKSVGEKRWNNLQTSENTLQMFNYTSSDFYNLLNSFKNEISFFLLIKTIYKTIRKSQKILKVFINLEYIFIPIDIYVYMYLVHIYVYTYLYMYIDIHIHTCLYTWIYSYALYLYVHIIYDKINIIKTIIFSTGLFTKIMNTFL